MQSGPEPVNWGCPVRFFNGVMSLIFTFNKHFIKKKKRKEEEQKKKKKKKKKKKTYVIILFKNHKQKSYVINTELHIGYILRSRCMCNLAQNKLVK